jgi:hypothetical protein
MWKPWLEMGNIKILYKPSSDMLVKERQNFDHKKGDRKNFRNVTNTAHTSMAPRPDTVSTQELHGCEDPKDYKYYIRFLCDAVALTTDNQTSPYLDNSVLSIIISEGFARSLKILPAFRRGRNSARNDSRTKFGIL